MNNQELSRPKELPVQFFNRLHNYILKLQEAVRIDDLWSVFLTEVGESLSVPISSAQLVYRAGLLFERIFTENGKVTHKTVSGYEFIETRKELYVKLSKREIVFVRRVDSFTIQIDLRAGINADMLEARTGRDEQLASLYEQASLFFNQLYLLLRIKNYEFHSIKDDITLAYNQNYLKDFIHNEIERARRYSTVFSLVFFDLDNLKAINEMYGHLIGTEILKEVAGILRSQVRKVDLLSRFGGDEFVIVLLHAGAEKAVEISQRIRDKLNQFVFLKSRNPNIHITGCFGISSFPENGGSVDELIRKADLAMYHVKRKGKNGIKVYEEQIEDKVEELEKKK